MNNLPNRWKVYKLGDFMEFKNGINTDKSQYGKGNKFVNVMDIFNNDFLTEDKIIGKVQVDEKKLTENMLNYGDILFNRTSETYDEIAMSATYLDDKVVTFGGFVIRGRAEKGYLEPNYSIYAFQFNDFRRQVIRMGQGAVRANIGQKDLAKVQIALPPLTEQTKIAEILNTWDKAINTTEKLLINSEQQKKALMQQLLTGKKRLKDKNGKLFCGEWKFLTFSKLFKLSNKKSVQVKSSEYKIQGSIPIIDQSKKFIAGYCDNDNVYSDIPVIIFGDHTRAVKWIDFKFCLGADGTQVLTTYSMLDKKFGYYLIENANIPNLGYSRHMRMLKEIDFLVPLNIEEQQAIAQVLTTADQQIDNLKQQISKLKQEKKALMQVLLSGKVRVKLGENYE